MKVKLTDITDVIRSKNAGPFELTFDIIFKDFEWFSKVVEAGCITPELIAKLYKTDIGDVLGVTAFKPAKAIKATIRRPIPSGDPGETDVYGAQQHAPLVELELEV